jgi:uncharacterized membrane protein YkgB
VRSLIARIDSVLIPWLRRWSLPVLRVSLGLVFVWFGALKVFGVTPVFDLVASTVYWVDPDWFVPALGVAEILIGIGLIGGWLLRWVLLAFVAQMVGTALVFVTLPEVAFQDGNPLKLTVEGEFVIKNLVLLAAGLVVGATIEPRRAGSQEPRAKSQETRVTLES